MSASIPNTGSDKHCRRQAATDNLPDGLPIEKVSGNVLTPALNSFCSFHTLSAESVKLMSYSRLRMGVGRGSVRDSFLDRKRDPDNPGEPQSGESQATL